MSWKIYNAYKFTGSVVDILPHLDAVRGEYQRDCEKFLIENWESLVVPTIKERQETKRRATFDKIAPYMLQEMLVDEDRKNPATIMDELHLAASIVLYPVGPRITLLQTFFGLNRPKRAEKAVRLFANDYHWQDQTDKPDEISTREWNQRRKVWEEVFRGVGSPVEVGLVKEFTAGFHFYWGLANRVITKVYK